MSTHPTVDDGTARDEVITVHLADNDPTTAVTIHLLGTRHSPATWDVWAGADFLGKIIKTDRDLRKPILGGLLLSNRTEPKPRWSAHEGRGIPQRTHHASREDAIRHLHALHVTRH